MAKKNFFDEPDYLTEYDHEMLRLEKFNEFALMGFHVIDSINHCKKGRHLKDIQNSIYAAIGAQELYMNAKNENRSEEIRMFWLKDTFNHLNNAVKSALKSSSKYKHYIKTNVQKLKALV